MNDDNLWKLVAIGLLSCALTGFTSWLTFGLNRVSHEEMAAYVDVIIKTRILEITGPKDAALERLSTKLDYVISDLQDIKKWNSNMSDRINSLERASRNDKSN